MEGQPFEVLEGQGSPTVRQLSVFLDNRVGQLLRVTQVLDAQGIKILAFSIMDSLDCAIVRFLVDRPDEAVNALKSASFAVSVAELIVVQLPPGRLGLRTIWSVLLSSEINISYAYPLLPGRGGSALAVAVDNLEIAVDTLQRRKFSVLSERDLQTQY
jgi:hypothetical protein